MTSPSIPATSGDVREAPGPVLQPLLVDDRLDRGRDLLADRPRPQIHPGHLVIVSRRDSASRGLLQWIVEIEPS